MKNYSSYLLFLWLLMLISCAAPKLSSYADQPNLTSKVRYDFNQNKIRKNGKGFSIDMKSLGKLPAKIAWVSFYIDDPGLTKVSKSPSASSWNTSNTGSENASYFANYFYSLANQTIKKSFAQQGMLLQTPDEFLKTEKQKEYYQQFVVAHTQINQLGNGFKKLMKNLANSSTTIETDVAADGFKLIKINNRETSDPKKSRSKNKIF